jgi:hypothetical protein
MQEAWDGYIYWLLADQAYLVRHTWLPSVISSTLGTV